MRVGEIFKRVSSKDLHELLSENQDVSESIFQLEEPAPDDAGPACALGHASSARVVEVSSDRQDEGAAAPFLLLDVRAASAYEQGHIRGARPYPALDLRRDRVTVELMRFKQDAGRPVIVYSDSEREVVDLGTLLVQKHFPNISILSASFGTYARRFPEDVVGVVRGEPVAAPSKKAPAKVYVARRTYPDVARPAPPGAASKASSISSAPWKPA